MNLWALNAWFLGYSMGVIVFGGFAGFCVLRGLRRRDSDLGFAWVGWVGLFLVALILGF